MAKGRRIDANTIVEDGHEDIVPRPNGNTPIAVTEFFDSKLLMDVCAYVMGQGFVTREDLAERFGPDNATRAIAVLFRSNRVLREATRAWTDGTEKRGYEWGDNRFSKSMLAKLPPYLGFLKDFQPSQARYKDFGHISLSCVWTNWVLAALPRGEDPEDRMFERDLDGSVIIPAYCVRAMACRAFPLVGKEVAAAMRVQFKAIRVPVAKDTIRKVKMPVVQGNQGKGLNTHEALPPGTKFTIEAYIPESVITKEDFIRAMQLGGSFVRLSPARSSGYGDFNVL